MFFGDLQRGDVDVVHHLYFSDGLQVFHAVFILHDLGVVNVNMKVFIIRVNFNLLRDKELMWVKSPSIANKKQSYCVLYSVNKKVHDTLSPGKAPLSRRESYCISPLFPSGLPWRSCRWYLTRWSEGWNGRLFCHPGHTGNWSQT